MIITGMSDRLDKYREHLRHIVRPEAPDERREAPSLSLHNYEALFLRWALVEYAGYGARDDTEEGIALGLAEYISMVVHDEEKRIVELYMHTDKARQVVLRALEGYGHKNREYQDALALEIMEMVDAVPQKKKS